MEIAMDTLYQVNTRLLSRTDIKFQRYLYNKIDWQERLIGLKGARGVGKTTMLLQRIKQQFGTSGKALYVSLDHLWFSTHTLLELAEYHYIHGGTHLFLDEVHRYPNWKQELKNIYDSYPDMNIVFTGSSLLELDSSQADLSRRVRMYHMSGLSFREYLIFNGICNIEPIPLNELLANHVALAAQITGDVKVIPHFENYLRNGYYPFHRTISYESFVERLERVVSTIIDYDVPNTESVEFETTLKIKKLLVILSGHVPYTIKITDLCTQIGVTRNMLLKLLSILDRADLIRLIYSNKKDLNSVGKPEKILFNNSNLMYALNPSTNIGTVRETFFAAAVSNGHAIQGPSQGDFLVDGNLLFEVGGKQKGYNQIRNISNSYVAADNIEIGHANKIPLWMFGLEY